MVVFKGPLFFPPPSICSHSIYLRRWKGEPLQVVFVHFHHRLCWICIVPPPSLGSYIKLVCSLFCCFFCQSVLLIYASCPVWSHRAGCTLSHSPPPRRLSRPRQHAPDQAWFLLSVSSTCRACVCVCKCHKDRQRVCYQEAAKRNRGNSIGLLWADFTRGDADFQPHSGKTLVGSALLFPHSTHI